MMGEPFGLRPHLKEEEGGDFAHRRCPRCGSPLLKANGKVWCSFVGGRDVKACVYGIDTPITLVEHDAIATQPIQ